MVDDLQNREEIMRLKEVGREGMIGQENGGVMRGHSTSFDGEGGLDPAPASSAVATRNHSINEAGSGSEDWKEKEKERGEHFTMLIGWLMICRTGRRSCG